MNSAYSINPGRLLLLIRIYIVTNFNLILVLTAVFSALIIIDAVLGLLLGAPSDLYRKNYFLLLFISGFVITRRIGIDLHDIRKGSTWLLLPASTMAITLNKSTFEPHVNDTFTVELGSEVVKLKLLQIIDSSNKRIESFVLQFLSSQSKIFQQQTYNMKHDKLGKFSLFLIPSGKDDKGTYYEAVVTRIIP